MLPNQDSNIYPKSTENIAALVSHYFDRYDNIDKEGAVEFLMKITSLSLNQMEFIAKNLSEAWECIFKDFFKRGTTVTNLMSYGINGLTKNESEWNYGRYSSARPKIKEFIQFVQNLKDEGHIQQ